MLYRVGRPNPLLLFLVLVHILSLLTGRRQWLHLVRLVPQRGLYLIHHLLGLLR